MSAHEAPAESEPRTPVWLTVLGACLFLALAVWFLAPRSAEPDATVRVPAVAGADEPAPPAPPSPEGAPPAPVVP